jgi:methyltransferase (TIGR00027 family)
MSDPVLSHISETALWVAMHRAEESQRPDAIFRDPLAERLAGERGRQIAAQMGRAFGSWGVIVRTKLIDDLVLSAIADGADRVVNLGAGLDTRPYRLSLPSTLTWIEADLPGILDKKDELLRHETPLCQLRRQRVDLADPVARRAVLRDAFAGAKRALVLTEGLLGYLDSKQVEELARELHAHNAAVWWISELASPEVLRATQRRLHSKIGDAARFKFGPPERAEFFRPLGWKARDLRSIIHEAVRLRRGPRLFRLLSWFLPVEPRRRRPWIGVIRFERTSLT